MSKSKFNKLWTEWDAWHNSKPKRKSQMTKREQLRAALWSCRQEIYQFNALEWYFWTYNQRDIANEPQETSQSD